MTMTNDGTEPPATAPVTAVWDDDAVLDPFRESLEEGRQSGRAEGGAAGYREGFDAGRLAGIEHGMEVGFARGVVKAVGEVLGRGGMPSPSSSCSAERTRGKHPDRIAKTLRDLEDLLNEFPGPNDEEYAAEAAQPPPASSAARQDEPDEDQPTAAETLQRIRVRCRLLEALLGVPHHQLSLATWMEGDSAAAEATTTPDTETLASCASTTANAANDW